MNEKFCHCGRLDPCKRHQGKEPLKRKKIGKYSGYSKAFELTKGAEKAEVES